MPLVACTDSPRQPLLVSGVLGGPEQAMEAVSQARHPRRHMAPGMEWGHLSAAAFHDLKLVRHPPFRPASVILGLSVTLEMGKDLGALACNVQMLRSPLKRRILILPVGPRTKRGPK